MKIYAFCAIFSIATTAAANDLELGYDFSHGTYTVAVKIGDLEKRPLTFDTGASYTVLDTSDALAAGAVVEESTILLHLPYEGKTKPAKLATVPSLKIGDCLLIDRLVVIVDLPEGRYGALGIAEIETLAPFTFIGNGHVEFTCPQ